MTSIWARALSALVWLVLAGCQAGAPKVEESDLPDKPLALERGSPEEMRYAALERIPVGTTLEDAKTLLEQQGFRCSYVREQDDVFLYARPKPTTAEIDESISLLFSLVNRRVSDVQVIDGPLPTTVRAQNTDSTKLAPSLGN